MKVYSLFLPLIVGIGLCQIPAAQQVEKQPAVITSGQEPVSQAITTMPVVVSAEGLQHQELLAQQQGQKEQEAGDLTIGPEMLNDILGGGSDDFNKLIQDLLTNMHEEELKKEAEKRVRLLNILPTHVKASVETASNMFSDLGSAIKMESCFAVLCKDIRQLTLTLVADDNVWKKDVVAVLEKLNQALADGSFIESIAPYNGGMTDLSGGMMSMIKRMARNVNTGATSWTEQDTVTLHEKLTLLVEYLKEHSDQSLDQLRPAVTTLARLLNCAQRKQIKELCIECIALIQPVFEKTAQQLKETLHVLADEHIKLPNDATSELKEALIYWLTTFKAHHHTIRSFMLMTSHAQLDFSFVLHYMSQVYDVVSAFFIANRFDASAPTVTGSGNWFKNTVQRCGNALQHFGSAVSQRSNLVDAMLRMSMVGMLYLHRQGEMATNELHKQLVGFGSFKDFVNPLDQWGYKIILAAFSVPLLINPTNYGERMNPINRAFWRIAGSFFWCQVQDNLGLAAQGNDKNKPIRLALAVTIKEAQQFLGAYFCGKIRQHADLVLLEKIETYTMGLVKPELVDLALEIAIPLLFMNERISGNVHLQKEDFMPFSPMLTQLFIIHDDNVKVSNYIEQLILHYACSNVGAFIGKSVAGFYNDSLIGGFVSLIKGIGNTIEKYLLQDEIKDELQGIPLQENTDGGAVSIQSLDLLKKLIASFFTEQSQERILVVGFLKTYGLLDEKVTDNREINYRIILMVFTYCINFHLLTHAQAADLLCKYKENYENNMEPFIDIIFRIAKKNAAASVGGAVGGFLGHIVANRIYEWHRPNVLPI